ncbi:Peroxisomal membrane protein 2 [Phytophthora citrophthora]|uniref:Peroxisomal membrane protein 2 n=1 Tax=Phytophthora citrophthora TaxID=4793 RepID=A0AAD9LRK1_9STRA|nr:Peroxisomal membrane protein 2 [Phytophthora citrophthora]
MPNGSLSYDQFCVEAELLQRKSHEVASKQEVGSEGSVATWQWRHGNRQHLDGDSYLVSTGNVKQYCSSVNNENVEMDKELGDIDELLASDEDQMTIEQPQDTKTALLEFHIVYHTIYQTPVLYFQACAVDGTPLPASTILHDVQFPGSNGRTTFVAMEEHPVLGKPFSFLHPCETAEAMRLLQGQLQSTEDLQVPHYLAKATQMTTEAARPRKKQRVGGVPPLAIGHSSSRAKFAFGSRIPNDESSLLRGPKLHTTTRLRHEITTRAPINTRKRGRSPSQDEEEAKIRAKPSYRKLTVKTDLPSHLPAPTKVSAVLNSSHLHEPSPSNGSTKRRLAEQQGDVLDLAATDPEYWIQRREKVEAALKELESIECEDDHVNCLVATTDGSITFKQKKKKKKNVGFSVAEVPIGATGTSTSDESSDICGRGDGLSPRQMLAFFAFGGVVTGPVLHFWYGYLETQRVTKEKLVSSTTPNKKLLLDRLLFTPPMVAFTIFSLGVLRGSSTKASRENLSRVYWGALLMNWKVWTLTQWLSFHYVPPHLRVLWESYELVSVGIGNCVALWWNSYLSLTQ